jgi:spore germination protein YaaH
MAIAAVLAVLGTPADAAPRRSTFQITGYASDWTPTATVAKQAVAISQVGVDGVPVLATGASVGPPTSRALALLAAAHANGLRATLLVGNWGGPQGVSPGIAARLLTSPQHRVRVAAQLAADVRAQGWDGITVDLELLSADDGPGLVAFVAALRARLPQGDLLAVDVAAPRSVAGDVAEGYRLPSLAAFAQVVLMAYDEHGPWSRPGPIGGIPWTKQVLDVARRQVPASQLVLGVAAYGFSWQLRKHPTSSALTDLQARALAAQDRRRPRWDARQGEYTVALPHRTVLWWSDSRSYHLRETLAKRLHLGGVAIWQLASADQLPPR